MSEPVTIWALITLLANASEICAQVVEQIPTALAKVRNISSELQLLKDEVEGLRGLLGAVESALNDRSLCFRDMYAHKRSSRDAWNVVYNNADMLKYYLRETRTVLGEIEGGGGSFGRSRMAYKMDTRKDIIASLRKTLGKHHLTLNTAWGLIQSYPQERKSSTQETNSSKRQAEIGSGTPSLMRGVREIPNQANSRVVGPEIKAGRFAADVRDAGRSGASKKQNSRVKKGKTVRFVEPRDDQEALVTRPGKSTESNNRDLLLRSQTTSPSLGYVICRRRVSSLSKSTKGSRGASAPPSTVPKQSKPSLQMDAGFPIHSREIAVSFSLPISEGGCTKRYARCGAPRGSAVYEGNTCTGALPKNPASRRVVYCKSTVTYKRERMAANAQDDVKLMPSFFF